MCPSIPQGGETEYTLNRESCIVNVSCYNLNVFETNVLEKGLSFIVAPHKIIL